jgi:hypothetical protein
VGKRLNGDPAAIKEAKSYKNLLLNKENPNSRQDSLSSGNERIHLQRGQNAECYRNVYHSNYDVLDLVNI